MYEPLVREGEVALVEFSCWGLYAYTMAVCADKKTYLLAYKHISSPVVRTEYDDPMECVVALEAGIAVLTGYLKNPQLWALQTGYGKESSCSQ